MPKPTATAPALPSNEKVTEAKEKLMDKKSKQIASAEEGRRSSVDLRTTWATSLKKGRGRERGRVERRARVKARPKVKAKASIR